MHVIHSSFVFFEFYDWTQMYSHGGSLNENAIFEFENFKENKKFINFSYLHEKSIRRREFNCQGMQFISTFLIFI